MASENRPIVLDRECGFGIWLGQPPDMDSICLGSGDTFDEALQDARSELMRAAVAIEQLRPASRVAFEVIEERARQDAKWGGPQHDDTHTLIEWWSFIQQRMVGRAYPGGHADERRDLIQIAALAIAAVESIDRKAAR